MVPLWQMSFRYVSLMNQSHLNKTSITNHILASLVAEHVSLLDDGRTLITHFLGETTVTRRSLRDFSSNLLVGSVAGLVVLVREYTTWSASLAGDTSFGTLQSIQDFLGDMAVEVIRR